MKTATNQRESSMKPFEAVTFSQKVGKTKVEVVRYRPDPLYYLRIDGMNMESFEDREWAETSAADRVSTLWAEQT